MVILEMRRAYYIVTILFVMYTGYVIIIEKKHCFLLFFCRSFTQTIVIPGDLSHVL